MKCKNLLIVIDRQEVNEKIIGKIEFSLAKDNLIDLTFIFNNLIDFHSVLLKNSDYLIFNQKNSDLLDAAKVKELNDTGMFIFTFFQYIKIYNDELLDKLKDELKDDESFDENQYNYIKNLKIILDIKKRKLLNNIEKAKIQYYAECFAEKYLHEQGNFVDDLISNFKFD
jgi:hypothetical protein